MLTAQPSPFRVLKAPKEIVPVVEHVGESGCSSSTGAGRQAALHASSLNTPLITIIAVCPQLRALLLHFSLYAKVKQSHPSKHSAISLDRKGCRRLGCAYPARGTQKDKRRSAPQSYRGHSIPAPTLIGASQSCIIGTRGSTGSLRNIESSWQGRFLCTRPSACVDRPFGEEEGPQPGLQCGRSIQCRLPGRHASQTRPAWP